MAGWVLTTIDFPAKALPGQIDQRVLMGLAGAFVLSTIPGLIAAIFDGMLRVTRSSHDATREALTARNIAATTAVY